MPKFLLQESLDFGGGGNSRQILPVVPGSSRAGTIAASLKRSDIVVHHEGFLA